MVIARTRNGRELLEFITGGDEPAPPDPDIPLVFTLIAATYQSNVVMSYNLERHQWEIPGGGIEPGETPYDCALRELHEESSQVAARMAYKGLLKFRSSTTGRLEYAALYRAEIDNEQPFVPNEEAGQLAFWNMKDALDGNFDRPFTLKLIELAGEL